MEDKIFEPAAAVPVSEVTRQLVAHMGPTVVAAVAGVRDRQLPTQWSIANGPPPESAALIRLRAAHQVWAAVAVAGGPNIARAWFLGANRLLGDVPPYLAIRAGQFDKVAAAAAAFVNGIDM